MNKKVILILSLGASAVLLTSMWITFVQSAVKKDSQIPTEWYQAVPSVIITEQWNWDRSNHQIIGGDGAPYFFYKRVGDSVFLTFPNGPFMVARRDGQSLTWVWNSLPTAGGGPGGVAMASNMTLSITFTDEDIPLTDEDNDYKGLRILAEHWQDVYRLDNTDGGHLWQGVMHQHFVSWAPKGSRA